MSDAAHVEQDVNAGTEIPGEVETKAREMGWRPKDEWTGDEAGWVDADRFVERQDRLKERADGIAKAEIRRLEGQVKELTGTLEEFKEHYSKVEQRAQKRAVAELKQRQREAVDSGDTAAFDKVSAEIDEMQQDVAAPAKKPDSPDEIPAYKDWMKENGWYLDDVEMTAYADSIAPVVAHRGGYKPTDAAFYDEVGKEVRKKFPDKFRNKRRDAPNAVESGDGGAQPRKGGKKGYSDLPPEAKAACDKFVKQKLMTREDYLKDYFEDEE